MGARPSYASLPESHGIILSLVPLKPSWGTGRGGGESCEPCAADGRGQ